MAKAPKKPKAVKPGFVEPSYRDTVTPELIERIESGRSLLDVCKDSDMPDAKSVYNWMNADPEYRSMITRAREFGYLERGERAVSAAKEADVPQKEIARQQKVHVSNISGKYIKAKKERTAGVI